MPNLPNLASFKNIFLQKNKMIYPFFQILAFFRSWRKKSLLCLFWKNFYKLYNILWDFKINSTYFEIFLKLWPFSHLRILPFSKLLMAKFGLFYFFSGPCNPASYHHWRRARPKKPQLFWHHFHWTKMQRELSFYAYWKRHLSQMWRLVIKGVTMCDTKLFQEDTIYTFRLN